MVEKATRVSSRGRSKSRTRVPTASDDSPAPVRQSKRKTPKKKKAPVVESESESESDEEEEKAKTPVKAKAKKTPTKKTPVKKTPVKKSVAAPAVEVGPFGTTIACRIMYLQLFAIGVGTMVGPLEVMKLAYGDSIIVNEITANAQRWLGVFILQLSFAVIAGAQGNHADQKKTLQYLMFLPLMFGGMVLAHMDVMQPDFLNGVVAVSFLDLGLMIWGCYYSD